MPRLAGLSTAAEYVIQTPPPQVLSVVGLLQDEADPMVSVMKVGCPLCA